MPFKKGFHPKTEFKKGHTSWCKKLHIQTNIRYDVENGITLCKECHKLTNNYKNKKICQ